jgi:hypothetical protein
MDDRLALLLHQLNLAYDRRSWHGPNLLGSLRGVNAAEAAWRPQPGRHNIAEIAVHCAYWKYRVCRLLDPEGTRPFDLKGSDWIARDVDDAGWRADRGLLAAWHADLLHAVERVEPAALNRRLRGEFTGAEVISGSAAHDLYHAGQIRLLRRMRGARRNTT